MLIQVMLSAPAAAQLVELSPEQLQQLGERIFANECNRRYECLTAWNAGEDFPSLGIGHFIWFQSGQNAGFEETFPHLLAYLQDQGIALPDWLAAGLHADSPWQSREQFQAEFGSDKMGQLRQLLASTQEQQVSFIAQRLHSALPQLLDAAAANDRQVIRDRFYELAASEPPYGLYALIDYVHFKGSGANHHERYQGQGWGLLQVLQAMPDEPADLDSFVLAAGATLRRRIDNAPAERNEQRWLQGWLNRLQTYLPESGALERQ